MNKANVVSRKNGVVAFCLDGYLPLSQTFIYEQVINVRALRLIVLAQRRDNSIQFPFSDVFYLPESRYTKAWIKGQIDRRLLGRLSHERIARREGVSILHAHFGRSGCRALPLKRKLGVPLITTFYGFDMSNYSLLERWGPAYRELFAEGDLFLTEGNHMKRSLVELGCPEEKIEIHHLSINTDRFKYSARVPREDGKTTILFVGRMSEKKGIPYAIQAISLVYSKHKNIEFRIIGDGELRPQIEGLIRELGVEDCVTLLGAQPHTVVVEEMARAHFFLSPSATAADGDSEGGAPTTLIEAQSTGLPIVSTYHADIPEVVLDGQSGFLVPERDVSALADRITQLIEEPNLWEAMGVAGRAHVEMNYGSTQIASKLDDIYLRCLE